MWRASKQICHSVPRQQALLIRSQPVRRCTQSAKPETGAQQAAPPPPPPPPPKQGGGVFGKLLGLSVVGVAGVTAAAWYDPNIRKSVEDNVPYSKDVFDTIFKLVPDSSQQKTESTAVKPIDPPAAQTEQMPSLIKKKSKVEDAALSTAPSPPPIEKAATKQELELKKKEEEKKRAEAEKKRIEDEKREAEEKKRAEKERVERAIREKEAAVALENAALEAILSERLAATEDAVRTAIDASKSAQSTTSNHTQAIKAAMDAPDEAGNECWESVTQTQQIRHQSMEAWEQSLDLARMELEKIKLAVSDGKQHDDTKKNKALYSTEKTLKNLSYDLNKAENELSKAQSEARVVVEYRDLVKKARDQFKKEFEAMMPDVKLGKRSGGKMTEDELNSLIAHAHRRLDQLGRQLAEQQAGERLRIEAALAKQRDEDDVIAKDAMETERKKWEDDLTLLHQQWETDSRVLFEKELRQQLARQAAAHSTHLSQVLQVQETELSAKHEADVGKKILEERDNFQKEVAGWVSRLRGIEAAVEGRAELEKQGRRAQELWLACQSLLSSIEEGLPGVSDEGNLKPLKSEFTAVVDASNNHPLVATVIQSIPEEAASRGVWTQEALIDRFYKVRQICKRTALIDETGGTLFKYFLSYFQSMLMFKSARVIGENEEVELDKLDTFILVDNAKHYLELGNLEQALRFINQLKGEPRRIASDWLKEARLLLETKQAAEALLAHASASGVGSLY